MKSSLTVCAILAALVVAAGCNRAEDGALPVDAATPNPAAASAFTSPLKAGGGAAMVVGPKPPGSTWKNGPPEVGQKLKG